MTQIAIAQALKKNTENQSMAAEVLRCRVGSANAASAANGGKPSISARSDPPIAMHATRLTMAQLNGTEMCRCNRCWRQRHSVHSASGQAGQLNQASCFKSAMTCALDP